MLQPGEDILQLSAHVYGNYHKYYTFHSAASRVQLLEERGIFRALWNSQSQPDHFRILDVGCNEGNLSAEIGALARKELPASVHCEVWGADIDSSLIQLANEKRSAAATTTSSSSGSSSNSSSISSSSSSEALQGPACSMQFHTVDFMNEQSVDDFRKVVSTDGDARQFNLVTVFSTTMWIHINHGDPGLLKFMELVLSFALPSPIGSLLVEPQPTKCYRTAVKRCRKLGLPEPRCYKAIKPEIAEQTVLDAVRQVRPFKNLHYLGHESWGRALSLFTDQSIQVYELPPQADYSQINS